MNQFLDIGRCWLLIKKHWSENKKRYSLSLIAVAGMLLLWFTLLVLSDDHRVNEDMQAQTYFFGLFIVGCLYGSMLFSELASKTRGLNYLIVPASQAEKMLCALFYGVFLFFVCYTALFYCIDIVLIKIGNAIAYSNWSRHHTANDTFSSATIFNIFASDRRSHESSRVAFYLLLVFFALQSAFMLGSIYFPRFSVVKTIIALLIAGVVMAFISDKLISHIMPAGSHFTGIATYHIYTEKQLPDNAGIMIYSNEETDKIVSLPSWIGELLLFIAKYAFAPLFWLTAYYRLKEKEI